MNSNEQQSASWQGAHSLPKPPVTEDTLKIEQVQVERKTIVCTLKENYRGRFLRISEEGGTHRDSIVIPATGLIELRGILDRMIKASDELPMRTGRKNGK